MPFCEPTAVGSPPVCPPAVAFAVSLNGNCAQTSDTAKATDNADAIIFFMSLLCSLQGNAFPFFF